MKWPAHNSDRIKLALIPVLGLILLGLFLPDDTEVSPAAELADRPPRATQNASARKITWPNRTLSVVRQHNPFELDDPRVRLDRAFDEYSLRSEPSLTPVDHDQFFAEEIAEQRSREELVTWLEQLEAERLAASEDSDDVAATVDADTLDAERLAVQADAEALAAAHAAERQRLLDRVRELGEQPISLVMQSSAGNTAWLLDRQVAEGEEIEPGIRIQTITPGGITFSVTQPASVPPVPSSTSTRLPTSGAIR